MSFHLGRLGLLTLRTSFVFASLLPALGCAPFRGVRGDGVPARSERTLAAAPRRIENHASVNVLVTTRAGAASRTAVLEGDRNLLNEVQVELVGETLHVRVRRAIAPSRALVLRVESSALAGVSLHGSGDVRVAGDARGSLEAALGGSGDMEIDAPLARLDVTTTGSGSLSASKLTRASTVGVRATGSGDVVLRGDAARVAIIASGSGDVDAAKLRAARASVRATGSGDVRVCATDDVASELTGSGDVEVRCGAPRVASRTTGSGRTTRR